MFTYNHKKILRLLGGKQFSYANLSLLELILVGGAFATFTIGLFLQIFSPRNNQSQPNEVSWTHGSLSMNSDHLKVIISVDATPNTGAAFIKLPDRRDIYFYSINLADHFQFHEDAKEYKPYENINALIALHVFGKLLRSSSPDTPIVLQTDNSFAFKKPRKNIDPTKQPLISSIHSKLKSFETQAEIRYVTSNDNEDIIAAGLLSTGQRFLFDELYVNHLYMHDITYFAIASMKDIKFTVPEMYVVY